MCEVKIRRKRRKERDMANQGLMCVWQAVSTCIDSGRAATLRDALRLVTAHLSSLRHVKWSLEDFNDVFPGEHDNEVTLEKYSIYVADCLRFKSYTMPVVEDEIEMVCWDLCKNSLREQGYAACNVLRLWRIFNRLCERDTLPPVMPAQEVEWLVKKVRAHDEEGAAHIEDSPAAACTFTDLLELLDVKSLQVMDRMGSLQKAVEEIYSWLVGEQLMCGWMWKRTRKQANWTSWLKRWFVLTPENLSYYDGPKMKVRKGTFMINKASILTDLPDTRRFGRRLPYLFSLENRPFLQLEMSAPEEADKEAWMAAITEVQKSASAGTTPMRRALSRRRKGDEKGNFLDDMTRDLPFVKPANKACACHNALAPQVAKIAIKDPIRRRNRSTKRLKSITEEQKDKIRAIFFSIDKDGNGKIDRDEFFEFLQKLGLSMSRREVDLIFENIQEKQDGKITMDGFYHYFVRTILNVTSESCAEGKLRTAFLNADRDNTGTIDFREFVEYVWERRRSVRISRVMHTFEKMDKEGNGQVTYGSFLDLLRKEPSVSEELALTELDDEEGGEESDDCPVGQPEDLLRILYEDSATDDTSAMVDYLRRRWVRFVSFKRPGASGDIVMKGKSGIISDVLPGDYNLVDLAAFSDLPPLIPVHAHLQGVTWESSSNPDDHGRIIFPADFDGVVPVSLATTELLRYYGCSLADSDTIKVSLMYRHAIQDFTYENQYISEYVANPKKQAGAGMEKHAFSHLDMPLDNADGYFVLGKLEGDELHLTAFKVPTRHCLYVPGGTIHTNDYLQGTWRTMLSDEAPIDHCHIMRKSTTAQDGLEKFIFNFKES